MSKLLSAPGILASPIVDTRTGLLTSPWQRVLQQVPQSPGLLGVPVVGEAGLVADAWLDFWGTLGASAGLLKTRMVDQSGKLTPPWQHFVPTVEI